MRFHPVGRRVDTRAKEVDLWLKDDQDQEN
jgi:hypothetical protein